MADMAKETLPTLSEAIRGGMMATIPDAGVWRVWSLAESGQTPVEEGTTTNLPIGIDHVDDSDKNEVLDMMPSLMEVNMVKEVEICETDDDDTNLCFISNKRRRQKSFSKRKRTLLKLAKDLHILTRAKVQLTITAESGNVSKSTPIVWKNDQ